MWLVGTLEIIWSTPMCCRSCNQGTAKRASDSCEEGPARGSVRGPRARSVVSLFASWVTSRPQNASLTHGAPTPALHGKGRQHGHGIFRSKMSFAVGGDCLCFPFSKKGRWERDCPSVGGRGVRLLRRKSSLRAVLILWAPAITTQILRAEKSTTS